MKIAIIGCSFAGGVYSTEKQSVQIAKEIEIDEHVLDHFKGWPYEIHKKYNIETHLFCHEGNGLLGTRFFIDEIIQHLGLDFFDKILISISSNEPRQILYKDYKFKINDSKENFYYYNILENKGEGWISDTINLWQLRKKFKITDTDKHNLLLAVTEYARSQFAKTQLIHTLNYIEKLNEAYNYNKILMFPYGWLQNELHDDEFFSLKQLKLYKTFKCYEDQSFSKFVAKSFDVNKLTVMDKFHHNEKGQKLLIDLYLKDILDKFING